MRGIDVALEALGAGEAQRLGHGGPVLEADPRRHVDDPVPIGLALMAAALAILAGLSGDPSRGAVSAALALFGLGFGMVGQLLVTTVQNDVEQRELGVATAIAGFFRALGGAPAAQAAGGGR